ncbi:hypothetical protein AQI95_33940 [Streptomyces yokosukanensis]|uniref:Uncharacterized protein n=2 Tax=Streptomyces yokosukanensis TaxID=67386 RepID=A0A101NWR8_9ACTN|nr:hypothetical protein AQI95_33940 [Streptomyces yokosukanensis]
MEHGPRVDLEHPTAPTDRELDSPKAPAGPVKPGPEDRFPDMGAGRITVRWCAGRWSRTERLRFARILFGNALREDCDDDHEPE